MIESVECSGFELFECQICTESLLEKEPHSLRCNHTFCHQCLLMLVQTGFIKCPQCRTITELPPGGIKELPLNFDLTMMKQREMEMALKFSGLCQICLRRHIPVKAVFKCYRCFQTMCDSCKEKHSQISIFRDHKVSKVEKALSSSLVCEIHHQSMLYLCHECMTGLCVDCLFGDEHVQHQEALEEIKEGISTARKSVEGIVNTLNEYDDMLNLRTEKAGQELVHTSELKNMLVNRKREIDEYISSELQEALKTIKINHEDRIGGYLKDIHKMKTKIEPAILICVEALTAEDSDFVTRLPKIKRNTKTILQTAKAPLHQINYKPIHFPPKPLKFPILGSIGMATTDCLSLAPKRNKNQNKLHKNEAAKLLLHIEKAGALKINRPEQIFCLNDGSVVVADFGLKYVQRLSQEGKLIAKYYPSDLHGEIQSIGFSDGFLYIANNKTVSVIPPFCSQATERLSFEHFVRSPLKIVARNRGVCLISSFYDLNIVQIEGGGKGIEILGGLACPTFVTATQCASGYFYFVTEYNGHRVSMYDNVWKKIRQIGGKGCQDGDLLWPCATAITSSDTLLVADWGNNRISEFSMEGAFLRHVLQSRHGIYQPRGLAVKDSLLWVTELDAFGHAAIKLYEIN